MAPTEMTDSAHPSAQLDESAVTAVRGGDDERYKRVENEFCGKHSTFFPRRFEHIAFVGLKIATASKTPHLMKIVASNPRTQKANSQRQLMFS